MEGLIVALFALVAIVFLEAGYRIAVSLLRWAPAMAAGALVGWLTHRHGIDPLVAMGLAILACLAARRLCGNGETVHGGVPNLCRLRRRIGNVLPHRQPAQTWLRLWFRRSRKQTLFR